MPRFKPGFATIDVHAGETAQAEPSRARSGRDAVGESLISLSHRWGAVQRPRATVFTVINGENAYFIGGRWSTSPLSPAWVGRSKPRPITRWNGRRTTPCGPCSTGPPSSSSTSPPAPSASPWNARPPGRTSSGSHPALRLPPADVLGGDQERGDGDPGLSRRLGQTGTPGDGDGRQNLKREASPRRAQRTRRFTKRPR
jgi:hypothetical protein